MQITPSDICIILYIARKPNLITVHYSFNVKGSLRWSMYSRGTQRHFSENICSEDDLRSRIFGTFVVKFLACLPLLGFLKI